MRPLRPLPTFLTGALALASIGFVAAPTTVVDGDEVVALCSEHPAPEETTVTSKADGIEIDITVFRPCAAATGPVPVILHSHGWGGSKSTSGFGSELDAGFGVVSITQRGHGDSGGQANVQNPELEAQDIASVIDHVASLDWVAKDVDPETAAPIADDPVLFAMGGSYGGGYQTMTALTEISETGRTRFNALAPEITWFDLPRSLAPSGVARSLWNTALYGAGAASIDLHPIIHEGFAWGASTGQWPDGTLLGQEDPTGAVPDLDTFFHAHSPVAFVEAGHHIDVPVLWRQSTMDTLFNLNEGLDNFERTLTDEARARSMFVSYHGGHTLPTAYPSVRNTGALSGDDTCSVDSFGAMRRAFFRAVADGEADPSAVLMDRFEGLDRYNLMADDEGCVRLAGLPDRVTFELGQDVDNPAQPIANGWMSTSGAGVATQVELEGLTGPATVAGIPVLRGNVATIGVDQRMLFGLSVGTSPADAQLVQAQLMPLRVVTPSPDITVPFELELGGVTVELAEGEKLFLTVTPFSEQFYGHGSKRTPGWMGFTDLAVDLPIVE